MTDPAVEWLETAFSAVQENPQWRSPYLDRFHPVFQRAITIKDQYISYVGMGT